MSGRRGRARQQLCRRRAADLSRFAAVIDVAILSPRTVNGSRLQSSQTDFCGWTCRRMEELVLSSVPIYEHLVGVAAPVANGEQRPRSLPIGQSF